MVKSLQVTDLLCNHVIIVFPVCNDPVMRYLINRFTSCVDFASGWERFYLRTIRILCGSNEVIN